MHKILHYCKLVLLSLLLFILLSNAQIQPKQQPETQTELSINAENQSLGNKNATESRNATEQVSDATIKQDNSTYAKQIASSTAPVNNLPKMINFWGKNTETTKMMPLLKTPTIHMPGFPTGDGEYDFNPDDLEALQDGLVDETLQGVSSIIHKDTELTDDFDAFDFPETPTEPPEEQPKTAADFNHIYRVPIKQKKYKKHDKAQMYHLFENASVKYDYRHFSNFHLFINLYDHHLWDSERILGNVSKTCGTQMKSYLRQLRNGAPLALKVSDSSGRYNGQYFFGNDFWVGSKMFCDEVNQENRKLSGYQQLPQMGFYVAKMLVLLEPYFMQPKLLQLGQCLPKSCEVEDIYAILRLDPASLVLQQHVYKTGLNVYDVRRVPGSYQLMNDRRFFILLVTCSITVVVMMVATVYESILLNNGYDLTEIRRSSRVKKQDIDQIRKNRMSDEKHMEMYRIGHQDNNNLPNIKSHVNGIEKTTRSLNFYTRMLLCFGLRTNIKVICSVERPENDSLTCVHGMRLLSLLWTILVHTYLQLFAVGENKFGRNIAERTVGYQIIGNATFSVDTFFFVSGVLVVYLYYKRIYSADGIKQKSNQKLSSAINESILAIMYRFVRLVPAYLFVLIADELLLKWTYDRSVFQPGLMDHITCNKYWYRNILFINNWYPFSEICMMWSWYLANDMQFYVIAIILLIISKRYFKTSAVSVILLLLSSWLIAIFVSLHFQYTHKVALPFESFDILYNKPWQRIGPYIVGMITGYVIVRKQNAPKVSLTLNLFLWCLSIAIFSALIFGVWNGELSVSATAIYVSIGHTAWGVALVWILLSCFWGLARPINNLLSYRGFYPLSRLTYCAYLIHPVIMVVTSFQLEAPFHLQHLLILTVFLGNAVLSFLIAFVISLMFEAPVIRLLKVVFK